MYIPIELLNLLLKHIAMYIERYGYNETEINHIVEKFCYEYEIKLEEL